MSTSSLVDLDDTDGLLEADRGGLLRAAATAGAQVRATAAAVDEGALDSVADGDRPRTVIWVAGRGPAESAGAMLAAALSGVTGAPMVTAAESPPWVGALDVLIVAGDDPGDPVLVTAAASAVRRGARVVVARGERRRRRRRLRRGGGLGCCSGRASRRSVDSNRIRRRRRHRLDVFGSALGGLRIRMVLEPVWFVFRLDAVVGWGVRQREGERARARAKRKRERAKREQGEKMSLI